MKQKLLWGIISIVVVAAAIVAGILIWNHAQQSKPKPLAPNFKVGTFAYANACQLFTADDFKQVLGKSSDRQNVTASFATAQPTGTNSASSCTRLPAGTTIDDNAYQKGVYVYINQLKDEQDIKNAQTVSKKVAQYQDKTGLEPFGDGARVSDPSVYDPAFSLIFFYQNKEVTIGLPTSSYADEATARPALIKLGNAMLEKLKKPLPNVNAFELGPKNTSFGSQNYTPACRLSTTGIVAVALKESVDSVVNATYAEQLGNATTLSGSCIFTQASAAVYNSNSVYVSTTQTKKSADATKAYNDIRLTNPQPISGMGDQAQIGKNESSFMVLKLRKGNLVASFRLSDPTLQQSAAQEQAALEIIGQGAALALKN